MLKINFFCILLNFSFRGAPVPKRGYSEHSRSILGAYSEHTWSILGAGPTHTRSILGASSPWCQSFLEASFFCSIFGSKK